MMWRGTVVTKVTPLRNTPTEMWIAVRLDPERSPGRDHELPAGTEVMLHVRDEDVIHNYQEYEERYRRGKAERRKREGESPEEMAVRIGRRLGQEMANIVRDAFTTDPQRTDPRRLLQLARGNLGVALTRLSPQLKGAVQELRERIDDLLGDIAEDRDAD